MCDRFFRQTKLNRWLGQAKADQSGQQMVEFTFTFIMLCVLLMALLGLGWVFYSYATIVNAARDGSYHLMTHPVLPGDPATFKTADAEATYVVTSTVSLLDWRHMTVNISPAVSKRVAGTYVAVEILYTVNLPRLDIPLGFTDTIIHLLGPIQLHALSRRSLD
jgi:Flp pilus assembly protein TadG